MSGGREAQLAFYYQNLLTILKILNGLRDGTLVSAKIEQKVRGSSREIDIILQFNDGHIEYYEVKSGETITDDGPQLKDCLLSLFENFKMATVEEQASYFLIINKDYFTAAARVAADVRLFKTHTNVTQEFKNYCGTWGVQEADIPRFHEFIKVLTLDHELGSRTLKVQALGEIREIAKDIIMNGENGLQPEDLLNRMIDKLLLSIEKSDGNIDLTEMIETIVDWCTRNEIASRHPIQQRELDEEKDKMRVRLQVKFPGIIIEPSPSPSEAISET